MLLKKSSIGLDKSTENPLLVNSLSFLVDCTYSWNEPCKQLYSSWCLLSYCWHAYAGHKYDEIIEQAEKISGKINIKISFLKHWAKMGDQGTLEG